LRSIDLEPLSNLKQGIGGLLAGLSLAFHTSLLGISLSVLYSLSYRFLTGRLEKALYRLDGLVAKLFPYHFHERYLRKNIELQADIKQGLQTLATDVATKIRDTIAPALDEAMVKHLVPIMKDLQAQVRRTLDDSRKKHAETIEIALRQYLEKMSETFVDQFQDMGRVIEETTTVQQQIKTQMVQFTEHLQNQFKAQAELIEKTTHAGQILSESLESLERISKELKSSAADITTAATVLEEAASKALEGQEALRESMGVQIEAMSTTRKELEGAWNVIIKDTESTVQLIREIIRELAEGVGEQLNKALVAFDKTVAEVVERFSGTLFEAGQTIEELPTVLTRLEEDLKIMATAITDQRAALKELNDLARNIVSPSVEKALIASNDLGKTAEMISNTTDKFRSWSNEVAKKLGEGNVGVNKEFLNALANIAAGVNEIRKDLRNELFEDLRTLRDSANRIVNSAEELTTLFSQQEAKGGFLSRIRKR